MADLSNLHLVKNKGLHKIWPKTLNSNNILNFVERVRIESCSISKTFWLEKYYYYFLGQSVAINLRC